MSKKIFADAIKQFATKRVLVMGDIMLDEYTIGDISRISPEAPVPVILKKQTKHVLGGAGNAAANLATLGVQVSMASVIGDNDPAGAVVRGLLKDHKIATTALLSLTRKPTIIKHRFMVRGQQVLRCDTEDVSPLTPEEETHIVNHVREHIGDYDAILCSDYIKGFFSRTLAQTIIALAKERKVPVIVDTKAKNKDFFHGATVVKVNAKEVKEMTGEDTLEQAGTALVKQLDTNVIVTASRDGMLVFYKERTESPIVVPTHVVPVVDVTGAGDTATALITLGTVSGLTLEDIATLANYAASVVVQKVGTATVSLEELLGVTTNTSHIDTVEIVPKLWGFEKWLENNEQYCSKQLVLNKGYQCSLHYHKIKDEMFLVTKGYVRMEVGEETLYMKPGSFVRIHPSTPHRFRGLEDSEILEISTTHMEEDSYRIEPSCKVE